MNIIKEWATLVLALFKNSPKDPLKHVEMKHVLWPGYAALTWAGLLITRPGYKLGQVTKTHEDIHRQQAEILGSYWLFYLLYLWEYLCGLFILWNPTAAYYTISLECQAYGNEYNKDYKVSKENMKLYRIKNKRKVWKENKNRWRVYCSSIEL